MTLTSLIFSTFTQNYTFKLDPKSIRQRYQISSLIVANCVFLVVTPTYEVITMLYSGQKNNYVLLLLTLTLIGASFEVLRRGNNRLAAGLTMLFAHICTFVASHHQQAYLVGIHAITLFPLYSLMLGLSVKYILVNSFLCFLHLFFYLYKTYRIFQMTLTDEQSFQLYSFAVLSSVLILQSVGICVLKAFINEHLWDLTEVNFQKSENLTKELVQVISSKSTFVSSLSHEMKENFSSINKNIHYLQQVAKNPVHLETLRIVKLNVETFWDAITNLIDAFDLKPIQDQPSNTLTDFVRLTEKALTIHTDTIQKKGITIKVLIDKKIPNKIWINTSRVSQIMINLISNTLKHIQSAGKVSVSTTWCLHGTSKENLMKPINDSISQNQIHLRANTVPLVRAIHSSAINLDGEDHEQEAIEEFTQEEANSHHNRTLRNTFDIKNLEEASRASQSLSRSKLWSIQYTGLPLLGIPNNERDTSIASASTRRGYLKVQITDNGQGIAANSLTRFFECNQEDQQSSDRGATFGLWVCKILCQKMNGDIQVYSLPNKGTTFVFYIPVDNTEANSLESSSTLNNIRPPARPPGKVTCLVVDDHPFNRDLHKLILEKEDVHTVVAADGKEALETYIKYGGEYFDFVLMDVIMPVMDGFESMKEIRRWEQQQSKRKTDIYFVSGGYFSEDEVLSRLKSGSNTIGVDEVRYLRKPIDTGVLRGIIKKNRERLSI